MVHYCVANMPGAVARTSTYALNNVTLPHTMRIADLGWKEAMRQDQHLLDGLNVWDGKITCEPVARELGYDYVPETLAVACWMVSATGSRRPVRCCVTEAVSCC